MVGEAAPAHQVLRLITESLNNGVDGMFSLKPTFSNGMQAINMIAGLWEGREVTSWRDVASRLTWNVIDDAYAPLLLRWLASFVRWLQGGMVGHRAKMVLESMTGSPFLPLDRGMKLSVCSLFPTTSQKFDVYYYRSSL